VIRPVDQTGEQLAGYKPAVTPITGYTVTRQEDEAAREGNPEGEQDEQGDEEKTRRTRTRDGEPEGEQGEQGDEEKTRRTGANMETKRRPTEDTEAANSQREEEHGAAGDVDTTDKTKKQKKGKNKKVEVMDVKERKRKRSRNNIHKNKK
jgi:hypothetical protein